MKLLHNIEKPIQYVITYYQLEKRFPCIERDCFYYDELRYVDVDKIHCGSYVKKWVLRFKSKKALKEQLKKWYPHHKKALYFHTSLESALKKSQDENVILILKEVGKQYSATDSIRFVLGDENIKRRNKKRTSKYKCDCFACVGMYYENKLKTLLRDEIKLN